MERHTWASNVLPAIDPMGLPMLTGTTSAGTLTSANSADGVAVSVAALEPPAPPAALGRIAITPTDTSTQRAVTRNIAPHPSRCPCPVAVQGGRAGGIFRLLIHCNWGAPRHARVCVAGAQNINLWQASLVGDRGRGRAACENKQARNKVGVHKYTRGDVDEKWEVKYSIPRAPVADPTEYFVFAYCTRPLVFPRIT